MENFSKTGKTQTFTAPSAVVSGSAYLIGSLLVVATHDAVQTASFEGIVVGAVDLPKLETEVWTQLEKIYWDNGSTPKRLTKESSGNIAVGVAVGPPATVTIDAVEAVGSEGITVDGHVITIDDYSELGGTVVTVTIAGVEHELTEEDSGDWEAVTGNDETAESLAAAIDALTGISATAVANVITVSVVDAVEAPGAPSVGRVRLDGAAR